MWTKSDMSLSCHVIALGIMCDTSKLVKKWETLVERKRFCSLPILYVYSLFLIYSNIKFSAALTHITWSICLILSRSSLRIICVRFVRAKNDVLNNDKLWIIITSGFDFQWSWLQWRCHFMQVHSLFLSISLELTVCIY